MADQSSDPVDVFDAATAEVEAMRGRIARLCQQIQSITTILQPVWMPTILSQKHKSAPVEIPSMSELENKLADWPNVKAIVDLIEEYRKALQNQEQARQKIPAHYRDRLGHGKH